MGAHWEPGKNEKKILSSPPPPPSVVGALRRQLNVRMQIQAPFAYGLIWRPNIVVGQFGHVPMSSLSSSLVFFRV